MDTARDQLKALGSLYQEKCLGVGDDLAWGCSLSCGPSYFK